jgi:hypothetical protein
VPADSKSLADMVLLCPVFARCLGLVIAGMWLLLTGGGAGGVFDSGIVQLCRMNCLGRSSPFQARFVVRSLYYLELIEGGWSRFDGRFMRRRIVCKGDTGRSSHAVSQVHRERGCYGLGATAEWRDRMLNEGEREIGDGKISRCFADLTE